MTVVFSAVWVESVFLGSVAEGVVFGSLEMGGSVETGLAWFGAGLAGMVGVGIAGCVTAGLGSIFFGVVTVGDFGGVGVGTAGIAGGLGGRSWSGLVTLGIFSVRSSIFTMI